MFMGSNPEMLVLSVLELMFFSLKRTPISIVTCYSYGRHEDISFTSFSVRHQVRKLAEMGGPQVYIVHVHFLLIIMRSRYHKHKTESLLHLCLSWFYMIL